MFERFTDRARKVMLLANQEAQRLKHEYIGTEHILLGLVREESGVGANVLKDLDVDLRKVRLEVEKLVKSGPEPVSPIGKRPQTPRAKKVIEYAIEEAQNLNHNYVGTEHLLLGLLRKQDGVAAQVLMNLNLRLEDVRKEVLNLLGASEEAEEASADQTNDDTAVIVSVEEIKLRVGHQILLVSPNFLSAALEVGRTNDGRVDDRVFIMVLSGKINHP